MNKKDNLILALYKAKQTIFTSREIALLSKETSSNNLKSTISYYVKTGRLIRLRRGLFAKGSEFDKKECAVRLYTPSYVSFETVLVEEGVIFQYYESIFAASYLSRDVSFGNVKVTYRKLKDAVLLNRSGVIDKGTYFQASKERAFLDMLYLMGEYYFDNLRSIDWEKCSELVSLYKNKSLEKTLKKYQQQYAQ